MASRKSLIHWKGALDATREILERLEAHRRADVQFKVCIFFSSAMRNLYYRLHRFHTYLGSRQVTANVRGSSAEEVAEQVLSQPLLSGLQVRFGTQVLLFLYVSDQETSSHIRSKEKLKKTIILGCSITLKDLSLLCAWYFFISKGPLNVFMFICAGTNCKSSLLQTQWDSGSRLL